MLIIIIISIIFLIINTIIITIEPDCITHHLTGLVVKVSTFRAEDPEFESACTRIFRGRVIPVSLKLAFQWLPCQAPGAIGSVLGLVGPVSIYCDWVRWKVWSATSISVWQHVKLSEQICPWDTPACCWNIKQPTNKLTEPDLPEHSWVFVASSLRCTHQQSPGWPVTLPEGTLPHAYQSYSSMPHFHFPPSGCGNNAPEKWTGVMYGHTFQNTNQVLQFRIRYEIVILWTNRVGFPWLETTPLLEQHRILVSILLTKITILTAWDNITMLFLIQLFKSVTHVCITRTFIMVFLSMDYWWILQKIPYTNDMSESFHYCKFRAKKHTCRYAAPHKFGSF